ncbi:CHAT domain-containing protein [Lactarius vividus]|nr:CHAT domain-containing protein [Lactarius vividus]
MFFKEYTIELVSFFSTAIISIFHVTILHLFSIISQRLVDGTSQEQQTEHSPTYPGGVTSEIPEELKVTPERLSHHEVATSFFREPLHAVLRKGKAGRREFILASESGFPHELSNGQRRDTPQSVTIETLPEETLLEIFNIYRLNALERSRLRGRPWEWHRLAHVSQRWRSVIFASSQLLGLRIFCTYGKPVIEILNSWPTFPIVMQYGGFPGSSPLTAGDQDGIVAVLSHPTRIREIQLTVTTLLLENMATLTRQPFSMLERLHLSTDGPGLVLPSEFGGGFSNLRILRLVGVALPALPQLLSSVRDLLSLQLEELPGIGYTLEALLICLPKMTRLETLRIHFLFSSPISRPILTSTPERRSVLPCLSYIEFHGTSEYLESLLSTFDAPFLKYIHISFFNQLIFPQLPQLSQFFLRTETQRSPSQATIHYSAADISVTLSQSGVPHHLALRILSKHLDWQISSMAELCERLSPSLSHVDQLNISAPTTFPGGLDDADLSQLEFMDLFRQFNDVRRLCVTGESVSHVAGALGPISGQLAVTVLPELREIYVGNDAELASAQSGLAPFLAARGHSVVIRSLDAEPGQNFQSHSDLSPSAPASMKPHPLAIQSLFQREPCDLLSFAQNDTEAVDSVVGIPRDLLDMHPNPKSAVDLIKTLESSPAFRSQLLWNTARTRSIPAAVLRLGIVTIYGSLDQYWRWATTSRMWAHSSTSVAYQNTLSALQSVLTAGLATRMPSTFFVHIGPRLHIPLEYSSYLIERGRLDLAVETIEQGKALIWSEIYGLCSSTRRLRRVSSGLAEQLAHFTQALEVFDTSTLTNLGGVDTSGPALEELQRLLRGRQEVIQRIQALPGFKNFAKSVPFRNLQTAAAKGPIVIINHCHWRSDILIVLHNSPTSLIPTHEGFYDHTNELETLLKDTSQYGLDSEHYRRALRFVLKELYKLVGQPVINRLQGLGIPEHSQIWWYPTSVFCSLPLHAMGPIPSARGPERYFSDIYVCSYTPTLSALIESRAPLASRPVNLQRSLLLVGQPDASLPGIWTEMEVVRGLPIPVTTLSSAHATRQAVAENLQSHHLVHFACHATLEFEKPLEADIKLHGEDRLTLHDIANSRLPPAEFAFLSACHTAELTDGHDPTEGLNIAAAMQYHGFGSVVGTMWDMVDNDGGDISEPFYRYLLACGGESHDVPLGERSARALRDAVQVMRRKKGMTLERWVNWVHYGA